MRLKNDAKLVFAGMLIQNLYNVLQILLEIWIFFLSH